MNDTIAEQAYRVVIEERIAQLLSDRRWYRKQSSPGYWFDLAQEARRELLILLRIRRQVRAIVAARPDPMDAYKSYHDWQASATAESVR